VSGIFLPFGMGVFFCTIGLCLRLFEGAVEPSPPDLTISCAIGRINGRQGLSGVMGSRRLELVRRYFCNLPDNSMARQ